MDENTSELEKAILPPESGALVVHGNPTGFSAAIQVNVDGSQNVYILFLIRALLEIINKDPVALAERGEELVKADVIREHEAIVEAKAAQDQEEPKSDETASNVLSLDAMRPKGNA